MAKVKSKKGKGKYARYRTQRHLETNKEKVAYKISNRLEKRKAWRVKKYANVKEMIQDTAHTLSSTTIKLFRQAKLIKTNKEFWVKFRQHRAWLKRQKREENE